MQKKPKDKLHGLNLYAKNSTKFKKLRFRNQVYKEISEDPLSQRGLNLLQNKSRQMGVIRKQAKPQKLQEMCRNVWPG